ncbi:glutamate--tRNA ligase family protein, partial [Xanthomonas citri pv. citri]
MLNLSPSPVIGRFAPSPTGALHLGSLVTAIASYCIAKQAQGKWLVRIEDTDTERCHPRFSNLILADLERLGLHWDGNIRYQSQHLD